MITLNPDSLKEWQDNDLEPLRYGYDLYPEDTVLDIGSYKREWGKEIINRYGCHVEYFDALDNRAAWLFDGEIEMGGQFYYTSMFDKGENGPVQKFKCVDIAPYLQKEIALVKINIEGGEYALLSYMIEKGLMSNIIDLQVQFHQVDGQAWQVMYDELARRLKQTHELSWRYPFCWESWQRRSEYKKQFHSV